MSAEKWEWEVIELNPEPSREWNFTIPYVWMTERYGRAGFRVCVRWKRKKITDVWISSYQQPNQLGKMWHLRVPGATGLHLSYSEVNPLDASAWMFTWCEKHRAQNFSFYVPDNTNCLAISLLSSVSLRCVTLETYE